VIPKGLFGQGAQVRTALARKVLGNHPQERRACRSLAFRGEYTPVLAKHSKRFSLEDALSIGVDRMQRNFEPMRQQVDRRRAEQLSSEAAKLTIYRAFIEGELDVPKHLSRRVA
jgi:hypothetical protein